MVDAVGHERIGRMLVHKPKAFFTADRT